MTTEGPGKRCFQYFFSTFFSSSHFSSFPTLSLVLFLHCAVCIAGLEHRGLAFTSSILDKALVFSFCLTGFFSCTPARSTFLTTYQFTISSIHENPFFFTYCGNV